MGDFCDMNSLPPGHRSPIHTGKFACCVRPLENMFGYFPLCGDESFQIHVFPLPVCPRNLWTNSPKWLYLPGAGPSETPPDVEGPCGTAHPQEGLARRHLRRTLSAAITTVGGVCATFTSPSYRQGAVSSGAGGSPFRTRRMSRTRIEHVGTARCADYVQNIQRGELLCFFPIMWCSRSFRRCLPF